MKILSNISLPGDENHEVLCYSGKFHDHYYYDQQKPCYFSDVLKAMPQQWEPDFVIFKSPLYFAVPYGIENCPYPTVLLLDDWFGGVDYLPDIFSKFDHIFTDKTSLSMLRNVGIHNASYWPLFVASPSQFHLLPNEKRIYDVTFTGNFNANIQGNRLPWLKRLADLDEKFSSKLFNKAWHEEYTKILNQSKIVFNHSIKGEMNQRAFEATSCGAMLFMEETNLEVRDFFLPDQECVLYNESNFESLLEYYRLHDDQRARIAENGYIKSQQFSFPVMFDKLVAHITGLNLKPGKNRECRNFYAPSPQCGDFVQTSLAMKGRGDSTLKNITLLITENKVDPVFLNDCAVILMTLADDLVRLGEPGEFEKLSTNALALLTLASKDSEYLTADFNKGRMLFAMNRQSDAIGIFKRLFDIESVNSYEQCKGLPFPLHYIVPIRFEWNMAITDCLSNDSAMAKKRLDCIRYFSACALGEIYLCQQVPDVDQAIFWYEAAHRIFPFKNYSLTPLAKLYMEKNDPCTEEFCQETLRRNPFDFEFWIKWADFLMKNGKSGQAVCFIDSCIIRLDRLQFATEEIKTMFLELKQTVLKSNCDHNS